MNVKLHAFQISGLNGGALAAALAGFFTSGDKKKGSGTKCIGGSLGRIAGLEMVTKSLSEIEFLSLSLQRTTLLSEVSRFFLLTSLFY